ncbi:NADP+-dependent D-mannitol dehydrogenase [Rickenella mellea]|uniref:NADP+-dependent D-mannitol dehydrogenase n=1 Tax=Rickenella mellea TaxID=50990 RepID=A0A4Y7QAH0_9AGAM|nr:NADP+-dependent D-mannitol dehydrogenase [Rickenella mellea]
MAATMKALWYSGPQNYEIKEVPIPDIGDDDVLLKVDYCGVCGTDQHIHNGEFISKFPLIPGHEIVGHVHKMGKNVKGLSIGDNCVVDNTVLCNTCFFCRRDNDLFCEDLGSLGVTMHGGFAEYVCVHGSKTYPFLNISPISATLIEPAACAMHGMDKLACTPGVEALLLGAGPTGLILAQLLKLNGAARVVIAAHTGVKMDIAKRLGVADEYVEIQRGGGGDVAAAQWGKLREENKYGFDVVVEATGVESVANESINFVRKGGKLMIYGVYDNDALVHWSPAKIFADEITIIGSFAQTHTFPRAVLYLDSGKVKVDGIVTDVVPLTEYHKVFEKMTRERVTTMKVVVKP